jgi:2-succinyl-6-hydroxy-2,4-cyclohexadiene-1-carboxylate synthase
MVRGVEDVVALHGFAGTGRMWARVAAELDALRFALHSPDLPGHGAASELRPITFAGCVEHVLERAPERFALAGYSMGGRLALHIALAAPERVTRLVLVATTAGIEDADARARRRDDDERLARAVERESIEQFADRWTEQPLFAGAAPDAIEFWRQDIARNDPIALAAALRGIGAGAMAPLWDRLAALTMPATVVTGGLDEAYVAIGRRLVERLPASQPLVVIDGAGHGLPRERPAAVAAAFAAARPVS